MVQLRFENISLFVEGSKKALGGAKVCSVNLDNHKREKLMNNEKI